MKYLLLGCFLFCSCLVAAAQDIGDKTATTADFSSLENSLSGDPLYVRSINGSAKIISKDEYERVLETDQVSYIQHITDPSSIFIYGDKGKNGVILIVMKGDSFSSKYPGRKRRQR